MISFLQKQIGNHSLLESISILILTIIAFSIATHLLSFSKNKLQNKAQTEMTIHP